MERSAPSLTTGQVAAEIRAELARRKISGRSLAVQLGWSTTTGHRRLSGTQPLTVEDIARIADFLGVPIGQLLPDVAA